MPLFNPPFEIRIRNGVELLGAKNGANAVFTLPEAAADPDHVEVFHNGRRLTNSSGSLLEGEFLVSESSPGAGWDTITFLAWRPSQRSELRANFYVP